MTLVTEHFNKEAQMVAKGLGRPHHRIVQITENIEIMSPQEIGASAEKSLNEIVPLLTQPAAAASKR